MAKASEQFQQSDVATWGIVALIFGAIAVLGANISAAVPSSILGALHKTRIEGASIDQLRLQVADLREQTLQLRRDNTALTTRFALGEQQGNAVQRRVGALEVSLPRMLEAMPRNAPMDQLSVTGSLGEALVYDADGGSVMIRRQPMPEAAPEKPAQPLPDALQTSAIVPPNLVGYGVALGPGVATQQASSAWNDLSMKLGPLLFGMTPLLVDDADSGTKKILVGPIDSLSEASTLCARLEHISIACMPMPFNGTPLSD